MKVKSLKLMDNGMSPYSAEVLWDKIEGFAAYSFNKSHSVEYTILSWWAMWAKAYYPAEFFAAAISTVEKEEKIEALVMDARRLGIELLPPDINLSTDRIEISGEHSLIAPFQSVKGISEKSAGALIELRRIAGGKIANKAELESLVEKNKMGTQCNKTHRERLERVGAFHSTDGGLPPLHPDRLRDRMELMPGFTVDAVKADRRVTCDTFTMTKVIRLHEDAKECSDCSLAGKVHPQPRVGRTPKFMVVFDCPSWQEEKAGKMLEGDAAGYFKAALTDAGLSANDGYYTALVKAAKGKGAKMLSNEQINGCSRFLQEEIALMKPPVILAMGANAVRFFSPGIKGNPADLVGKTIFDPKRDATVVFGLNPSQVLFDGSKVSLLQTVCAKVAELINP